MENSRNMCELPLCAIEPVGWLHRYLEFQHVAIIGI